MHFWDDLWMWNFKAENEAIKFLYAYLKDLELDRFTTMALGQCAEQKTACSISFEKLYNAWLISCMRGVLVHG
jgi:hypothetical protein